MKIQATLDRLHIHYFTDGKNTKRGCVSMRCPVCSIADHSDHLNINLNTGFASCWRDRSHTMSFHKLISLLAGPSAAAEIQEAERPAPEDFASIVATLRPQTHIKLVAERMVWPSEAKRIRDRGVTIPFWEHLCYDRHIPKADIEYICDHHDLRCCPYGSFTQRILLPIHNWMDMIAFTGRAIGEAKLRYKAWPPGPAPKQGLFGLPPAKQGGRRLVLVEGGFDALVLNVYAPEDCHAVAVLSTSITTVQKNLIEKLAERFDEVVVLLDSEAEVQATRLRAELTCPTRMMTVPPHRKDPGELNAKEAEAVWFD